LGEQSVQLRERHWRIFSLSGTLETVRGRGVVGQEPVLSKKSPAFQYSSHVSLQAPSGHMWLVFKIIYTIFLFFFKKKYTIVIVLIQT
jgi:polymerase delta-interacting protein 2